MVPTLCRLVLRVTGWFLVGICTLGIVMGLCCFVIGTLGTLTGILCRVVGFNRAAVTVCASAYWSACNDTLELCVARKGEEDLSERIPVRSWTASTNWSLTFICGIVQW